MQSSPRDRATRRPRAQSRVRDEGRLPAASVRRWRGGRWRIARCGPRRRTAVRRLASLTGRVGIRCRSCQASFCSWIVRALAAGVELEFLGEQGVSAIEARADGAHGAVETGSGIGITEFQEIAEDDGLAIVLGERGDGGTNL